jgi:hypothetical protein
VVSARKKYTAQGKTVEELLLEMPKDERVIVQRLRSLVQECLPAATEKVSYGCPFYSGTRMICYICPPSLLWGQKKEPYTLHEKGVALGFCYGHLMANDDGTLLEEGRKQVTCYYIRKPGDIHEGQIRAWLFEAGLIDDTHRKKTISKKKKY